MAKALFGSVVAPHELRVVEENAALRARVRRLEAQLAVLQEERDAGIARELLGMAEEPVRATALASTSA